MPFDRLYDEPESISLFSRGQGLFFSFATEILIILPNINPSSFPEA